MACTQQVPFPLIKVFLVSTLYKIMADSLKNIIALKHLQSARKESVQYNPGQILKLQMATFDLAPFSSVLSTQPNKSVFFLFWGRLENLVRFYK